MLHKADGLMKKEDYLQQLDGKHNWQLGVPTKHWSQTHVKTGFGMDKAANIKLLEWSSQVKLIKNLCTMSENQAI